MAQLPSLELFFIDLEINPETEQIFKVGALRVHNSFQPSERFERFEEAVLDKASLYQVLERLDALASGADYLVGHNIIEHDRAILKTLQPELEFLTLPTIDTLQLSPLAFPRNPYHRLLKDYKLIRSALNSPLHDCESSFTLFSEQLEAFYTYAEEEPHLLGCYQTLLSRVNKGYESLFKRMTGRESLEHDEFTQAIYEVVENRDETLAITHKVCVTQLETLLDEDLLLEAEIAFPFLYTLAWLSVSGGNSVLAPWVCHQFPETHHLISILREERCDSEACSYCTNIHNPRKELQRYFGFDDFRYEDYENNESIQRDVVELGMRGENVLAILPTGGGKSLCYQIPALNRYFKNGSLTVIISPLQSLMKDQVDGLLRKGIQCAAALNGLLTLPERSAVLEKIQMGDIGILLVSPEQFRSSRFKRAIEHRQIGAWIYDEVHCLSKWGNDFRPDYLYVAKCIKALSANEVIPPIGCFTATAKQDVIEDIKAHFNEILAIEFIEKISHKERENLSFDVRYCDKHDKIPMIIELLNQHLSEADGGAIIFVSRRRIAEEFAAQISAQGWESFFFHAGMGAHDKKDIQSDFIAGKIRVMVATNAFGMGVDKDNVRLVVHADIPGSLENYLQEAGRAGRDQGEAKCVLLYEPNDVETQFMLTELSKLTYGDINAIYKKIRAEQEKRKKAELVISSGEILKDALVETFDSSDNNAKTKVMTAIAWLERANYLERTDNVVRIFPAYLTMTLDEAVATVESERLSERTKQEFISILNYIAEHPSDKPVDTDQLAELIAGTIEEISTILQELQRLKILTNNTQLTSYVRYGVEDSSKRRLEFTFLCEKTILSHLQELSPDLEKNMELALDIAMLCELLNTHFSGHQLMAQVKTYLTKGKFHPLDVNRILQALSEDREIDAEAYGKNQRRYQKSIELKPSIKKEHVLLKINHASSWQQIEENALFRQTIADKILDHFLSKVSGQAGNNVLVETTFEALQQAVFSDPLLIAQIPDIDEQKEMVNRGLLYLHQLQIITLNHGMTVMRHAVTLNVDQSRRSHYLKQDYKLLQTHYKERRGQIHVMREYAVLGLEQMGEALKFVYEYFSLSRQQFTRRHFKGREHILSLGTSEGSWKKIVEPLNEVQRKIVESGEENHLILAGPGSGKTLVIVHRIAYLLRVERVPAHAIIALTYNRAAANEIRKRLFELVKEESYGITVMTYHGIAMKMTGRVYRDDQNDLSSDELQATFQSMISDAIELLEDDATELELGLTEEAEEDQLRAKLLRGYQYVLVDEYQDIDEDQYRLISALSGRNRSEEEGKLTILAVGDDDQNIYAFRGTSNEYIDRFTADYDAKISYLVENYRSTQAIIDLSNAAIEKNQERLKADHPIEINEARKNDPYTGRWETLDPKRQGHVVVRVLQKASYKTQAFLVLHELKRLQEIDAEALYSTAILARTHEALMVFAGGLEDLGYDYYYESDKDKTFHTRAHRYFKQLLDFVARRREPETALTLYDALQTSQLLEAIPSRWQLYFSEMFEQLKLEFGGLVLQPASVIQWIKAYGHEVPIAIRKGVFLGTIHSAKGLEFDHLFLIDHLNKQFQEMEEVERRLYYVGMTRAKETLMICSFTENNPFVPELETVKKSIITDHYNQEGLAKEYLLLGPKDIYMDFLGMQRNHRAREVSLTLHEGDALTATWRNGHWFFSDPRTGIDVARSSANFVRNHSFTASDIADCRVHSITERERDLIKDESFRERCQGEAWEAIQPLIILSRESH